jgi:8-oxo-dGTP diphosphatase
MSKSGQRLDPTRYTIVPRTLSFVFRGDHVLLLRLGPDRGEWAGKLNGLGGHIEAGEDALTSARREIREEAGISPGGLRLCGVVFIDTGEAPGIGLYVFVGEAAPGSGSASGPESDLVWADASQLSSLPLVEDLSILLPRALESYRRGSTFSALSRYDADGALHLTFGH